MVDQTNNMGAGPGGQGGQYQYDWQDPNSRKFDFGRVFGRTFEIVKRDGLKMALITLALIGLPMAIFSSWPAFVAGGFDVNDPESLFETYTSAIFGVMGIGFVLLVIASLWLQPTLIRVAYGSMKKENVDPWAALRSSARYILPFLGFAILYFIAMMIGLVLLIIPGLLIALGWMVGYHVMILENRGVMESFGRAWELSKGHKRWVLLLAIVMGIIGAVIGAIISIPLYIIGNPSVALIEGASTTFWIFNAIISALGQVVGTVLGACWSTAAYVEMRRVKEGLDLESQADVFS